MGDDIPIYVADYVLMNYGGGAIMAVPAHDERDFDFARRHDIPAPVVIAPPGWDGEPLTAAYVEPGVMVNSGPWDGLTSEDAVGRIADWMEATGIGRRRVQYRLRDWLISRQRYWGAPIPIVHCEMCGPVPVPEADLPVLLPHIKAWKPGGDVRSPLANVPAFMHTNCPNCGRPAQRESDTIDGFGCSSWYFLRFVSPRYAEGPFDPAALAVWGPPDLYVGGAEHAVMHLLYARFFTKVMADAGLIRFREPFPVLRSQGVMHARDAKSGEIRRMSKSAGNVVTPDSVAEQHGADALRIYLLFMAPFENNTVWEEDGITGAKRFLHRVWRLGHDVCAADALVEGPPSDLTRTLHQTIRQVTAEIERFQFNTAVAALMTLMNAMTDHHRNQGVTGELEAAVRTFVLLLAPFAPHISEELWACLGGEYSVHQQPWPAWDETLAADETVSVVIQINGRTRDRLAVPAGTRKAKLRELALTSESVGRHLVGQVLVRTVVVPDRIVNLVTAPE